MSEMQGLGGRASAGVEVELLASLVSIEDVIEVSVGEEDAAAEEDVGRAAGETRDAVDEGLVEALAAELVDELVVVDFAALLGRDFPRRHDLFLLLNCAACLSRHDASVSISIQFQLRRKNQSKWVLG